MPETDDLSRALRSWLREEAAPHSPREVFETVVVETRSLRPRPAWLATLRGAGFGARRMPEIPARVALALALVALALAVVGMSIIAGGSVRPLPEPPSNALTGIGPSPTAIGPSPTIAAAAGPILELPAGVSHNLTVAEVEQRVVAEMHRGSAGLTSGPIVIRRVALVPPNTPYPLGSPDVSGNAPGSMSHDQTMWVVEANGTDSICTSFCDASDGVDEAVFDSDPNIAWVASYLDQSRVYPVPAQAFRETLARHGLVYEPADSSAGGILDAATVMKHLDPGRFPARTTRQGPVFGVIVVADPKLAAQAGPIPASPAAGGSRRIWWVQLMDAPWSWAVVDAVTGATLDSGVSNG